MTQFKKYKRIAIAEIADWTPEFDMTDVSVSKTDLDNGSPKEGDKIGRNPCFHSDQWLIAKEYFENNFKEIGADEKTEKLILRLREMIKEIRRKPIPISDVIPMLAESADTLESISKGKIE